MKAINENRYGTKRDHKEMPEGSHGSSRASKQHHHAKSKAGSTSAQAQAEHLGKLVNTLLRTESELSRSRYDSSNSKVDGAARNE